MNLTRVLALPAALLALAAPAAAQALLHVDAAAASGGNGSLAAPFRTLQEAADAASNGDRILIAGGIYAPFATTNLVSLEGLGAVTVDASLDASLVGSAIGVPLAVPPVDVVIEGVDFIGRGAVPSQGLRVVTGGDVTVRDCSFSDHDLPSGVGGGLHIDGLELLVTRCSFVDNRANRGAGLFVFDGFGGTFAQRLRVEDCAFRGQRLASPSGTLSPGGAALHAFLHTGAASVTRCIFEQNEVNTVMLDSPFGALTDSTFTNNSGGRDDSLVRESFGSGGGGNYAPLITACTFRGPVRPSTAPSGTAPVFFRIQLRDCEFIGQPSGRLATLAQGGTVSGSVVYGTDSGSDALLHSGEVSQCTLAYTRSGAPGAFGPSPSTMSVLTNVRSTIIYEHEGAIGNANILYSRVPGGYPGAGNIADEPQLHAPLAGDVRLGALSPCIDTGVPFGVDPDGTRADMGARPWSLAQASPAGRAFCVGTVTSSGVTPTPSPLVGPSFNSGRDLGVVVSGFPPSSFGLLFYAPFGRAPWTLSGALPLCVGPLSERSGVVPVDAGGNLNATLTLATLAAAGYTLGDHVFVQAIARDAAHPTGIALSSAVQVLIED